MRKKTSLIHRRPTILLLTLEFFVLFLKKQVKVSELALIFRIHNFFSFKTKWIEEFLVFQKVGFVEWTGFFISTCCHERTIDSDKDRCRCMPLHWFHRYHDTLTRCNPKANVYDNRKCVLINKLTMTLGFSCL